jgi:putative endonuclease
MSCLGSAQVSVPPELGGPGGRFPIRIKIKSTIKIKTENDGGGDARKRLNAQRGRLGRLGEIAAREELERRGYRVVALNFRCREGEADLVAEEGEDLVFIEVKTRSRLRHGLPLDAVGWTKQQRLGAAALRFCHDHEIDDRPVRFDVVEVVVVRGEIAAVQVHQDAFSPE